MNHETEVTAQKQLSDGQFAVCVRCCGDEKTDSWITLGPDLAAASIDKAMLDHHRRVAAQHAGINAAEGHPQVKVGTKCMHD